MDVSSGDTDLEIIEDINDLVHVYTVWGFTQAKDFIDCGKEIGMGD